MRKTEKIKKKNFFVHETSIIDENVKIGRGTKIWHWCHISRNVKIGKNCNIGQNIFIGEGVVIGDNVKIQNNVSVYSGVNIKKDVFIGPSVVFTNIVTPRSFINAKKKYLKTVIDIGATLGANSTILCGIKIGKYSLIGAGTVCLKPVNSFTKVVGNPSREIGRINKNASKKNNEIC